VYRRREPDVQVDTLHDVLVIIVSVIIIGCVLKYAPSASKCYCAVLLSNP